MVSRTWPQQIPGEAIWRFSMQENVLAASALPRTHTGGVYSAAPGPVASPEGLAVHCPRTHPTPLSALWASSFVPRPTVVVVVKLLNKMQHEEPIETFLLRQKLAYSPTYSIRLKSIRPTLFFKLSKLTTGACPRGTFAHCFWHDIGVFVGLFWATL